MSCIRSQTRKLQDMFKALQAEKEQLRRQYEELQQRTGMRNSGPAGGAGGRSCLASRPSGHGSGRQMPLFQGSPGTQMVSVRMHSATDNQAAAKASALAVPKAHVFSPGAMQDSRVSLTELEKS
jgi:hypothetical protein